MCGFTHTRTHTHIYENVKLDEIVNDDVLAVLVLDLENLLFVKLLVKLLVNLPLGSRGSKAWAQVATVDIGMRTHSSSKHHVVYQPLSFEYSKQEEPTIELV